MLNAIQQLYKSAIPLPKCLLPLPCIEAIAKAADLGVDIADGDTEKMQPV
jgi:hypothetical protein